MKDLSLTGKSELKYILPLIIISLIPRIGYFLFELYSFDGLPVAYDTEWYLEHAYAFLASLKVDMDVNGIFYLGYYSLLALLLGIFKSSTVIVLFQMIVNALTVVLVYKISHALFNRRTAVLAGIIYAITFQIIYWSIFIITDSFFISLLLLTVYLLIMSYKSESAMYRYLFVACSLYMLIFRPTGLVTLTFIFVYIMINLNYRGLKDYWIGKRLYLLLAGLVIILTAGLLIIKSGLLDSLIYSLEGHLIWLLSENYATGRLFDIETPYDYKYEAQMDTNYFNNFALSFFINNWNHILVLYARRAMTFLGVWVWKIGDADLLIKLKYLLPIALGGLLGIAGISSIVRNRILKETSILFLVVLSIQFFCLIFFMDSAYRYRVPSLVFLGILVAYGIDRVIDFGESFFDNKDSHIKVTL